MMDGNLWICEHMTYFYWYSRNLCIHNNVYIQNNIYERTRYCKGKFFIYGSGTAVSDRRGRRVTDVHERKIIATINVRINAACPMIDRRCVMTPLAHNGNIKRAQLWGVVTNDPRGAAHLLSVSRRKRRYFYLFATTTVARRFYPP